MIKLLKFLLLPFSFLYGLGVSIYQALYFSGILKSVKFSFPVVCIGNLSVGGTGKSPHVEYLVRLLKDYLEVGVLSRGYKRKTMGFYWVEAGSNALEVGDEPAQIKSKFPDVAVAVAENRALGIPRMIREIPDLQLIVLDDAFQHLEVKCSLNILLTEFSRPYTRDHLMPSGRLREWSYGAARADVVIASKCPDHLTEQDFEKFRSDLRLNNNQKLFFSKIKYGEPYHIFKPEIKYKLNPGLEVTLISAIAQSEYLESYLNERVAGLNSILFEDHHFFTETELNGLVEKYNRISHSNKMVLTTEKDATRLKLFEDFFEKHNIDVYAIPIEVEFYQQELFDEYIKQFLLEFRV
ncbi:MAG: tetraacyldisaccharide 4'-kinase [Saprospiraceae bacterium]|nr:tetraacyldisaccharide 4'-kinase [Saprospiraceae bacterium]